MIHGDGSRNSDEFNAIYSLNAQALNCINKALVAAVGKCKVGVERFLGEFGGRFVNIERILTNFFLMIQALTFPWFDHNIVSMDLTNTLDCLRSVGVKISDAVSKHFTLIGAIHENNERESVRIYIANPKAINNIGPNGNVFVKKIVSLAKKMGLSNLSGELPLSFLLAHIDELGVEGFFNQMLSCQRNGSEGVIVSSIIFVIDKVIINGEVFYLKFSVAEKELTFVSEKETVDRDQVFLFDAFINRNLSY